jgi:NADH:ubiquinone oxidoreductase subunit 6 (subunit J)
MSAYIGCILFGLMFVVMMSQSTGAFGARMAQTMAWMHAWAPISYLLLLIVLAAPIASFKIMHSWPKHVEPENPMAKYRRGDDVMED